MLRFFKHRILRLGRRQEGVAALEFALCLIPLLLLVGVVYDKVAPEDLGNEFEGFALADHALALPSTLLLPRDEGQPGHGGTKYQPLAFIGEGLLQLPVETLLRYQYQLVF